MNEHRQKKSCKSCYNKLRLNAHWDLVDCEHNDFEDTHIPFESFQMSEAVDE